MKIDDREKNRLCATMGEAGKVFNLDALQKKYSPVFIVRDIAAAKMLAAIGYEAVGLEDKQGGAEEVRGALARSKTRPGLVISLPWEDGFIDAADRIKSKADELKTPAFVMDAEAGEYIDVETVAAGKDIEQLAQEAIEALKGDFAKKNGMLEAVAGIFETIENTKTRPALKTGFPYFDSLIGGGLYPGLYTIGAEPAAGKTAFVMQIADHIAKNGQPVFVFSVEMSRDELFARSVSRATFELSQEPAGELGKTLNLPERLKAAQLPAGKVAKTAHDVIDGSRHANFSALEQEIITDCIMKHGQERDGKLFIVESFAETTAEDIRAEVDRWKQITGLAPVVIVDYLQILAPINDRGTDKQNADAAVKVLKGIARTYRTPVIVISSLNRSSYDEENGNAGFKETGGIEYTADVTIRLYLPDVLEAGNEKTKKEDKAKAKEEKKTEILQGNKRTVGAKILKSRFERPYQTATFDFYGAYSCFIPKEDANGFENMPADADLPFNFADGKPEQKDLFGKVTPPAPKKRV